MKARFTHWYNALAATLLSLLGFSSCGENGLGGGGECLYGTPTSTFQVKGNVTDEEGNPIQGIKTKVEVKYGRWAKDSIAYTDSNGNYLLGNYSMTGSPTSQKEDIVKVIFEDVDGEANGGTFANDTVQGKDLTIKQTSERDGSWYLGSYEITANAKLKKKQ